MLRYFNLRLSKAGVIVIIMVISLLFESVSFAASPRGRKPPLRKPPISRPAPPPAPIIDSVAAGATDSTRLNSQNISSIRTVYPTTVDLNNCGWYDAGYKVISAIEDPEGPDIDEVFFSAKQYGEVYEMNTGSYKFGFTPGLGWGSQRVDYCPSDRSIAMAYKHDLETYKSKLAEDDWTPGSMLTHVFVAIKVNIAVYCCALRN